MCMQETSPTKQEIERRALELGASQAAIFKWRKRGIPAHWQIKLFTEFGGSLDLADLKRFSYGHENSPSRQEVTP